MSLDLCMVGPQYYNTRSELDLCLYHLNATGHRALHKLSSAVAQIILRTQGQPLQLGGRCLHMPAHLPHA